MIQKVTIKNFKHIEDITVSFSDDITSATVLVGPNNSGKSTLLQALCLWEIGIKNYLEAQRKGTLYKKGHTTINRKDLTHTPVDDARYLWSNRKVTISGENNGQSHIPIEITLWGKDENTEWNARAEFIFNNAESFTCRFYADTKHLELLTQMYEKGYGVRFGYLQPMSGLAISEDKLTPGSIERKLGEGRTAEVLRNICNAIVYPDSPPTGVLSPEQKWVRLNEITKRMFGVKVEKPEYSPATGLLQLEYTERGVKYDVSAGGRGFQQTLLVAAYLLSRERTILLIDEPDAHLEIIRQREIFDELCQLADETNSQLIIVSHSEVILNSAAERGKVLALIENKAIELNDPHKVKDFSKALSEFGWDKYYLARLKGSIVFLEGETDKAMLTAFAEKVSHKVLLHLRNANFCFINGNNLNEAVKILLALQLIYPELKGLAIFDRLEPPRNNPKLKTICWTKRELENYFAFPYLLEHFAELSAARYGQTEPKSLQAMRQAVADNTAPAHLKDLQHKWWSDAKTSEEWFEPIFQTYFDSLHLPNKFPKGNYHILIKSLKKEDVSPEIVNVLDELYDLLKEK